MLPRTATQNTIRKYAIPFPFINFIQIVERHVSALENVVSFENSQQQMAFFNLLRTAAYGALELNVKVWKHQAARIFLGRTLFQSKGRLDVN